jgi:hypothetical protein
MHSIHWVIDIFNKYAENTKIFSCIKFHFGVLFNTFK